jgi:hypothetical protein
MRIRRCIAICVLATGVVACTKESRQCQTDMEAAQQVVLRVDAGSMDSVKASLTAVEGAVASCDKAERYDEKNELVKARNQLRAHLDTLQRRATDPGRRKLTPEELETLVKSGDPSCPKGQGYRHGASGKDIRCVGPQLVEMGYAAARAYFDKRGYKIVEQPSGTLTAEYGAERFVLEYASPSDEKGPRCFTLQPAPELSWQEATARVTGVSPERLKPTGTINTKDGPKPLLVQAAETKALVRIGDCGK